MTDTDRWHLSACGAAGQERAATTIRSATRQPRGANDGLEGRAMAVFIDMAEQQGRRTLRVLAEGKLPLDGRLMDAAVRALDRPLVEGLLLAEQPDVTLLARARG